MSKRVEIDFDKKLKFNLMYNAFMRSSKGKNKNKEVVLFKLNLGTNLLQILKDINDNKYVMGKYRCFKIYEPKERIILSLPFRDRVVQQWYVEEFIKPIFCKKFINNSYACIEGKGSHLAIKELQKEMRKRVNSYCFKYKKTYKEALNNMYILKCDITKFFYSIDREILFNIIKKSTKGDKFLNFTSNFIFTDDNKNGIPIGNYTSQYFANIYLNELDHYVKENLKVKSYFRYMDDFICLFESKEECRKILDKIRKFVTNNLRLSLNKKTEYFKMKQGVNFLGVRILDNKIKLTTTNKKRLYKEIKKMNNEYKIYFNNSIRVRKMYNRYKSIEGYLKNITYKNLLVKIANKIDAIYCIKGG